MMSCSGRAWLALAPLLTSPASAIVVVNNGLEPPANNVIYEADGYDGQFYYIQNVGCDATVEDPCTAPGAPTGFEVGVGARANRFTTYQTSSLLVRGQVNRAYALDRSTLTVGLYGSVTDSGGIGDQAHLAVTGGRIQPYVSASGSSSIHLIAGRIDNFYIFDSASIRISGGIVQAPGYAALTSINNDARLVMTGGWVDYLDAWDTSRATIQGGAVQVLAGMGSSTTRVSGGFVYEMYARENSVIELVGWNFEVGGLPVGYGPLAQTSGHLTGTYANGDSVGLGGFAIFGRLGGGQIVLVQPPPNPVPTGGPLARLLLAGALLAAAAWVLRRRRTPQT